VSQFFEFKNELHGGKQQECEVGGEISQSNRIGLIMHSAPRLDFHFDIDTWSCTSNKNMDIMLFEDQTESSECLGNYAAQLAYAHNYSIIDEMHHSDQMLMPNEEIILPHMNGRHISGFEEESDLMFEAFKEGSEDSTDNITGSITYLPPQDSLKTKLV
jgi:hypothetical protein